MPVAMRSADSDAPGGATAMGIMRWVILLLVVLVGVLQYRLWIGDGSFEELYELRDQIADYRTEVERLQARNLALAAEVRDLKTGMDAIEDRARSELGMIRRGEVFLQVIEKPQPESSP